MDTLPGIAQPRRRQGATEALLAKTLRAWHVDGILSGDTAAAARGVLRDAAKAVDQARAAMYDGTGSPYSLARCNTLYMEALDHYGRREDTGDDAIDALIANISGPAVFHGPDAG